MTLKTPSSSFINQPRILHFDGNKQDYSKFFQIKMSYLGQACPVCPLRLHVNQVLVEVLKLLHSGPECHDLAGGVCRGTHLCFRHPATHQSKPADKEKHFHWLYLSLIMVMNDENKLLRCKGLHDVGEKCYCNILVACKNWDIFLSLLLQFVQLNSPRVSLK